MITLELVSRKRNPVKRYAFYTIIAGILVIVLTAVAHHILANSIRSILMVISACMLIAGLFIINYSYKFKKVIGSISFSEESITTMIFEKKETFFIDNLRAVRFRLSGYEGLNKTTFFEYIMLPMTMLSYHSGINNFVILYSESGTRRFEFYIPDRNAWNVIKRIEMLYKRRFWVLRTT